MYTQFLLFNLIFALLVACYWLLFRQKSYFLFNRFLLLALLPIACLLPNVPSIGPAQQPIKETIVLKVEQAANPLLLKPSATQEAVATKDLSTWSWLDVLAALYFLGLIYFTVRFLWQNYQLFCFIKSGKRRKEDGFILVEPQMVTQPFSFFKYLVLPQSVQPESLRQQIIQHELVHIRQWHCIDILIANWLKIICWWNPMVWLYRKLIEQNQEFLVDQTLLKTGVNPKQYQYNLLKVQFPSALPLLTNSYNYSFIKKRIQMMQSKLNPSKNWSSYLLLSVAMIPLLLIFGKRDAQPLSTFFPTSDQKHILVIFDRNATLEELESVRPEIEAAGLQYYINNYSTYPDGSIKTVSVGLFRKNIGGGWADFQPLEKNKGSEIQHLFYTTDGNFSFGGLYFERLEKYLKNPEEVFIRSFGLGSEVDQILETAKKAAEVRKKEREAYLLANDYRGKPTKSMVSYSEEDQETLSDKIINDVKKYIQKSESRYGIKATYQLDGQPADASALNQAAQKIEMENTIQVIYDKNLEPMTQETIGLQIKITRQ